MKKVCMPVATILSMALVLCRLLGCPQSIYAQGGVLSDSLVTMNDSDVQKGAVGSSYYAIIAGIADYPGSYNDLEYTDDDALDMRDALLRYSNWHHSNIQMLLDGAASVQGIYDAIETLAQTVTSNDVLLFYFSGHGTNKTDAAPIDEADGKDEYLCAYDDEISDDQLSAWLGMLQTNHVVVILDTCFSGGQIEDGLEKGARQRALPGTSGSILRGDGFAADLQRSRHNSKDFQENDGYIVLTACDDNQLSIELSTLGNGLFTYFALMVLGKDYDNSRDGSLSAEEVGRRTVWSFWAMYSRTPSLYSYLGQMPQFLDGYPIGSPTSAELPLCY